MRLLIGHTTALLVWRAVGEGRLPMPEPCDNANLDGCITGVRQLDDVSLAPLGVRLTHRGIVALHDAATDGTPTPYGIALPEGVSVPLDILVTRHSDCHGARSIRAHLMSGTAPDGAFWRVTPDVLIASPGLCLLQSCIPRKTLPNLELALELCGSYSLAPTQAGGIVTHAPVTTTGEMAAQIDSMKGARHRRIVHDVLTRSSDGSRSPKETELYIMLTAPTVEGGYGLPKPELNQRIAVSEDAICFTDDPWYEVDMLYRKEKVIVEYDGRDYHSDPQAIARDKSRRGVLGAMGYKVIVISKEDLVDSRTLGQKVAQIARLGNFALHVPDAAGSIRREALHAWLFVGSHAHLPFGFGY